MECIADIEEGSALLTLAKARPKTKVGVRPKTKVGPRSGQRPKTKVGVRPMDEGIFVTTGRFPTSRYISCGAADGGSQGPIRRT